MERAVAARLVISNSDGKPKVLRPSSRQFLQYGAWYCFPTSQGGLTRGVVATGYAASPFEEQIRPGNDPPPFGRERTASWVLPQHLVASKGYRIASADQLGPVLRETLQQMVPELIEIPIDYSPNLKLMQNIHQHLIH